MTQKSDARVEEKLICCFKNDKYLVNFDLGTQKFPNFTLIDSFCAKYITFDLKKYIGDIFHDPEQ